MGKNDVAITPLGDRVLIKPLSGDEEKSPSGIIIPDTVAEEKSDRGEVLAVGPGRVGDDNERIEVGVKKGDKVIYQWGEKLEYGGDEYYLVSEGNILAIIG